MADTETGEAVVEIKQEIKEQCEGSKPEAKHSENYQNLLNAGLDKETATEVERICTEGFLKHEDLDERALDALKDFPPEVAGQVLKQFREINLEHVTNKSAYLCGMLKTWRTRNKLQGTSGAASTPKGPDEAKLKEILDRTGYTLDVTTGQRKYGGPPPDWDASEPQPGAGCEVFCGKVPKDIFEDELIPLFEKCGRVWDLRLMMDPMTGLNRGYAFVTFCEKEGAQAAVKQADNFEIKKGKRLKVNMSTPNLRLFVGNIPKNKSKDEILAEFAKITTGLQDVIVYSTPDEKKKNRGFCFLEYDSHKSASLAKRRLSSGRTKVWNCDIIVDWADPQEEPDEDTMSKVKVLYVRNLKSEVSEEKLKDLFEPYGKIERVKKLKDYGFVHFENREDCIKALHELNNKDLEGAAMEICLAKPPADKKKKEQRQMEHQRRLVVMRGGGGFDDYYYAGPPAMRGGPMGHRGGRGGRMPPPPYFDDYYEYPGGYNDTYYDDYYGGYDDYEYGGGGGGGGGGGYGHGGGYPPRRGPRGRGAMDRGRGRGAPRGRSMPPLHLPGRGAPRGMMRGGGSGMRAAPRARGATMRGGRGMRGAAAGAANGKRKFDGGHQGQDSKRRFLNKGQSWGTAPIAQQPLSQSGGGYNGGSGQRWYEDSYGAPQLPLSQSGGGYNGGSGQRWYEDSYGGQW